MGLNFEYLEGQTPIDEEEKLGLKVPIVSVKRELDEFEQKNIEDAMLWSLSNRWEARTVFSAEFLKKVHKQMFKQVWSWAGQYRMTNKNIGVEYWKVASEAKQLIDDAHHWYEYNVYVRLELAIRFKHRLVSIHCFPNGNGRHSRLMADIIMSHVYKQPVFTWGSRSSLPASEIRSTYIRALKQADRGEFGPLIEFAES
ncbi:MAG: mobile mystery protein B [Bacteroidetes bacterium]|nr:mobile mystery protein B [Bacteroidota bacterium]MDA1112346.1 mobile mystery protein B [Bacteroidota bacterium]